MHQRPHKKAPQRRRGGRASQQFARRKKLRSPGNEFVNSERNRPSYAHLPAPSFDGNNVGLEGKSPQQRLQRGAFFSINASRAHKIRHGHGVRPPWLPNSRPLWHMLRLCHHGPALAALPVKCHPARRCLAPSFAQGRRQQASTAAAAASSRPSCTCCTAGVCQARHDLASSSGPIQHQQVCSLGLLSADLTTLVVCERNQRAATPHVVSPSHGILAETPRRSHHCTF